MSWVHLAGALAMASTVSAQAPPPESAEAALAELSLSEIIALQTERYRRLTVPVTIMGEGPFHFMIDTGSQATVLSRDLADRLALHDRQAATLIGMASSRPVETTSIPDLALGSRSFRVQTAPIVEGAHIGGADGILGLDSLQGQRVLFDFEKLHIAVADAEDLGGNNGFDIVVRARRRLGQLIIHRAKVNGLTVDLVVDTGAQGSIGNPALQKRLRRAHDIEDAVMTDVNGEQITGAMHRIRRLQVGRVEMNNLAIAFADSPTFHGLGLADKPALILGMSELRLFKRVAIDFRQARILFDLPASAPIADLFNTAGAASRIGR